MKPGTYESVLSEAFRHIGRAIDLFQTVPPLTGGLTNGHTLNGHAAAKALPKPSKVKKAPVKALPAPATPAPAVAASTAIVKASKKKASKKASTKSKAEVRAEAKSAKAAAEKAAAKTTKKAAKSKAEKPATVSAAGRKAVASGERPVLRKAIAIVMGKETLSAGQILEKLKARNWQSGSGKPQSVVSYELGQGVKKGIFQRVERGDYKVVDPKSWEKEAAKFGGAKSGKAERVASDNAEEAVEEKVIATPEPVEAKEESAPEVLEAAPAAGDPPNATSEDATTTAALAELGITENSIGQDPFDDSNFPA